MMLMYLITQEDKREQELRNVTQDIAFRQRVFAADAPYGWHTYHQIFKEEDDELEGIQDATPESPEELQALINEMKRAGVELAD